MQPTCSRRSATAALLLFAALSSTTHAQNVLPGMIATCTTPNTFALTFDDGPSPFTDELVEILDAEKVVATFFMLGNAVANPTYHPVIKKIHARGHQIAVHTWDHPDLNKLSKGQIQLQLNMTDNALREVVGLSPNYMRPPFGECTAPTQAVIEESGYVVTQWDVDSNDWKLMNKGPKEQEQVTANFVRELAKLGSASVALNGAAGATAKVLPPHISLQHDTQSFSVRQTGGIIRRIKELGYRFDTVQGCTGKLKPMYRNAPDAVFSPGGVRPPQLPGVRTAGQPGAPSPPDTIPSSAPIGRQSSMLALASVAVTVAYSFFV